jgi:two-component system CheB/CheR fusion protein
MSSLIGDAHRVLEHLVPVEREVITAQRDSYLRRTVPYRTKDNQIAGVVVTFTDISRLKAAGAAQSRFAALMKASGDAIVVHDLQGRILAWNQGATKLYGRAEAEVEHRPVRHRALPRRQRGHAVTVRRTRAHRGSALEAHVDRLGVRPLRAGEVAHPARDEILGLRAHGRRE